MLYGCRHRNLKNFQVRFPLGTLTVVAGVSGSGKSTLVSETLYPALAQAIYGDFWLQPGEFDRLEGAAAVKRVLLVDQSPLGRTSRSTPATYIGVFDEIRALFAQTQEARWRGFSATAFSFNRPEGACAKCRGQGRLRVSLEFLPDIWVTCEECRGQRFKESVLAVDFKGKNIAEILALTVAEAEEFFAAHPKIREKLTLLRQIGLGYLELGQISPTLSGGEAQRLKLARELVKKSEGGTVYLLDEPTTGLHFADLEKLLYLLDQLVARGDTVIIIEHNLEIIRRADWLVELGPEGGESGGRLLFQGTPAALKEKGGTPTAAYL